MNDTNASVQRSLTVVGIGASAGGLEALERFFSSIHHNPRIAYLIVQHLSPDYKSHMVELLSKYTILPVHEAQDGLKVDGGHIYLLPPKKNMTIFRDKLYLVDYDRSHGLNLPIDIFLNSLAKDKGARAVACILSGTGSDGTRGIRTIKEHGGMVLAQDDSAKFDGMPRSAIGTQLVDHVTSAEGMGEIIERYVEHPYPSISKDVMPNFGIDSNAIGKVLAILRDHHGMDFTGYKPNTLMRRIERRMTLFELKTLDAYVAFLQRSEAERNTLYREFLIGVTSFFRDAEAFDFVRTSVIPRLMAEKPPNVPIRVWVTGCSTGEEAYSLAILFQDYFQETNTYSEVKIFATDLDSNALDIASQGLYPESVLADIPNEFLQNYFVKQNDVYEISRKIRGMVVFARQNLISDPPFSRIDFISCRNLLIYLQSDVQSRVMSTFQFALNPGGFLLLGSSESLGQHAVEFDVEDSRWKIFRYRGEHESWRNIVLENPRNPSPVTYRDINRPTKPVTDWRTSDSVLRSLVESTLPACVVIDGDRTLIHAFGDTDPFITAPRGVQVNLNIMNMVRKELSIPLSTALHRTFRNGEDVTYAHIEMETQTDEVKRVTLSTRLFWNRGETQRLALVLFKTEVDNAEVQVSGDQQYTLSDGVGQRIDNLEQELQYTRANLQSTIEELETSNEELQATNEELMAANEELQSTNEELESVNEELITVNNEYQIKIKELSALNDDMNNLLKSIDIGTVFLDADLTVRKFTAAAQQSINLLEQDIGRPIGHFAHQFIDFDLVATIENVLESLQPQEVEVQDKQGRWLRVNLVPYRTHTNQINGVVFTMVDITDLKETLRLAEDNGRFSQVVLNSLSANIAVLERDGTIIAVNDAWARFSRENGGSSYKTDVGTNYLAVTKSSQGVDLKGADESYEGLTALINGEIDEFELEYPCHAPHEERWFLMRAVPLKTEEGRIVMSHINITAQKKLQLALEVTERRLELAASGQPLASVHYNAALQYTWIKNYNAPYPTEGAVGKADKDFLPENEAQYIREMLYRCVREGQPLEDQVWLSVNGEQYTAQLMLEPIRNEVAMVTEIIGVFRGFVRQDVLVDP